MATSLADLPHISDLVHAELRRYLPDGAHIDRVTSEILPSYDGEDYVRTTVVLEDGHPALDFRALNRFYLHLHPLCAKRGFALPGIAYANKSELP